MGTKIKGIFLTIAVGILSKIEGTEAAHIAAAFAEAEKLASLGPGQSLPVQLATVSEHGNKYELWLTVRRQ